MVKYYCVLLALLLVVCTSTTIRIGSFNVLAPSWAANSSYAEEVSYLLTPWEARLNRSMNYVTSSLVNDTDFLAFQETEITINGYIANRLNVSVFEYVSVFHDDDYWGSYIKIDPPFNRNGVSIAVNKMKYSNCSYTDLALGTGNHALVALCYNKILSRWIRVVSVHFDSDTGGNRGKESKAVVDYIDNNMISGALNIIAGDYNADTDQGVIKQRITDAGFIDVFKVLGDNNHTHPFSTSYYNNNIYGLLDHITVRGQAFDVKSVKVHNNDLFTIYPDLSQRGEPNETPRVVSNMQLVGSDHFPIEAILEVSN